MCQHGRLTTAYVYRYHGEHQLEAGSTTTDVLAALHCEHHPLGYPDRTAWHHRFSHLVGYGARDLVLPSVSFLPFIVLIQV